MPARPDVKTLDQVDAELNKKPEDKRTSPKEMEVERTPDGLYQVRWTAGGEVPDLLKGRWTSYARGFAAVQEWQTRKDAVAVDG